MNRALTKIVFAPNAFKECLTASQACQAMQIGVDKAFNSNSLFKNLPYETAHVPLADGGDGTMQVLIENNNGHIKTINVQDPLGRNIDAKYGIFCGTKENFNTAVIEMAECSGLWRMAESEKNPLFTHTFGTGQCILDALNNENDIGRIIITVGGSATNDAGFGIAKAFGVDFEYECNEKDIIPSNCNIPKIKSLDKNSLLTFQDKYNVHNIDFIVGCDVNNPLLGSRGATAIYGPQKLSDEWIRINHDKNDNNNNNDDDDYITNYRQDCYELMENNLTHMNNIWTRDLGLDVNMRAGSGAAGGLAAGLMVYLNARLESGFEIVAKYAGLDEALNNADLVITGEGAIDSSTSHGKVPVGVAQHTKQVAGLSSVVCVAGIVKMDNNQDNKKDVHVDDEVDTEEMADLVPFALANGPMTLENSMKNASKLMSESVYRICQLFLHNAVIGKDKKHKKTEL